MVWQDHDYQRKACGYRNVESYKTAIYFSVADLIFIPGQFDGTHRNSGRIKN